MLLLFALHLYIEVTTDRENLLSNVRITAHGDSRDLVVLVHGYTKSSHSLRDLVEVIEEDLPDADILAPNYDSRLCSNVTPDAIAVHLRREIADAAAERGRSGDDYERIILVGHSVGALLVRKAYLDELQGTIDSEQAGPQSWADRVDRIILIAGMNRGWSLAEKPRDMRWSRKLVTHAVLWIGRLSCTGYFIRGVERGAPFVGDLRIQWIRAARDDRVKLAPVYQMLGLKDDVVARDDDMDLATAENFTFIDVPGGHGSIVTFPNTSHGEKRRRVFATLVGERDGEVLRALGRRDLARKAHTRLLDDVSHIVFIVHGIRDDAEWIGELESEIAAAAEKELGEGEIVHIVTSEYGYFPMGSFLISPWRKAKVRWFVDRYTEELARATRPDVKVSFIGHSNGTYLLAKGLTDYDQLRFNNVAFIGSVVPQSYPWDDMMQGGDQQRIAAFRNDRGASDWVVAVFPRLFEQLANMVGAKRGWLAEIGSGGFVGFEQDSGHRHEYLLHGGHSAGIVPVNFPSLARFVLTGSGEPDSSLVVHSGKPNTFVRLLSKLAWLIWLTMVVVVVRLGLLLVRSLRRFRKRPVSYWLSWPAYIILILALLQTV
ncbi:MAG: alpha/beta hydrolase [Phycisphaerales bacterium]|nr:alpha/beta hydrolase [Phycisphaerales bacterium]